MRAGELATPFPRVFLTTSAWEATRILAEARLPGLIVCEEDGSPHAVLGGSQVLRFVIPQYIQDDPALARVYDERASEELLGRLSDKSVQDLLPRRRDRDELPVVDADATTVEIAAVLARTHSPLVAVVDDDGAVMGAVKVSTLLERMFPDPTPAEEEPGS